MSLSVCTSGHGLIDKTYQDIELALDAILLDRMHPC